MRRSTFGILAVCSLITVVACGSGDTPVDSGSGGDGATTSSGTGASAAAGGSGAMGGGSTGGGSTGGAGTGGGSTGPCSDGAEQPCYTGDPDSLGVGPCSEGTQACVDGAWGACEGQVTPIAELCDGVDEDCNGTVDDPPALTCGQGACLVTVAACDNGQPADCVPLQPAPTEACDGLDDDCDGVVDNGCLCTGGETQPCYGGPAGTVGVGLCTEGSQLCSNGSWGACVGDVQPDTELCNGIDDNCDGAVDEGCGCTDGEEQPCYGGPNGTAGVGECLEGTQSCSGGAWQACSSDATPIAESCDTLDNDCDGSADEDNPDGGQACNTGQLGVCADGTTTCNNGSLDCLEDTPSGPELCDGLDNNCDGTPDDGNPESGQVCNTGQQGVCADGTTDCQGGAIVCSQDTQSSAEICDGLDNDCNGLDDDGNPGGGQSCNTGLPGVCDPGTSACSNGAIVCNQDTQASNEICDGLDNNCDGTPDDGDPEGGQPCSTGQPGVCDAGTTACDNGSLACNQNTQPSSEICDGLDNNCDGTADDGNPESGQACNTGQQGVCAAGTSDCQSGSLVCTPDTSPSSEICDGLDNDCDGTPDDGNPGGGQACLTGQSGVCALGTTVCQGGAIVCNANQQASTEICDGLDNDCDGIVDDGDPGGGQACNTGQQGVCAAGTTSCQGGAIQCNPDTPPSSEICDGLDNDCDGTPDDGNPGSGQSCSTGQQGVCSVGVTDCSNGSLVCNQVNQPSAEICDGLDNNCDGFIDDGNPGGGGACNTGLQGVCAAGTLNCVNGSVLCEQDVPATTEVCANGLDDNCDGVVDESNDFDADGWGACDNDCCDAGFCSTAPELINPGAFEVVGNGLDDDCDPASSDTVPAPDCSTVPKFGGVTPDDMARAIDLCQFTTANPPLPTRKWGVIDASFRLANGNVPSGAQLTNMSDWQSAIMANYGTGGVVPQLGPTMAAMSSGRMRDQNDPGYVNPNGGTSFGSNSQPPAVYLAAHGGSLPSSASCYGNCPAGSGANDSINLRLEIRVPTNALSFAYQFRFFSSEYWDWACTDFNDFYLALLTSSVGGLPADTNISFDSLDNPVSVNNSFFEHCQVRGCSSCPQGTGALQGTGMQLLDSDAVYGTGMTGGGTVWLRTTAPIVPGETMVLELMTFDVSDNILDSLSLLDAFTWSIDPSGVGTTPG